jgi:hypothetical protein
VSCCTYMMPSLPPTGSHEHDRSLLHDGQVVVHVWAPHVFQELHAPHSVISFRRPPRSPAEVVLDHQLWRKKRLSDGIVRALHAQHLGAAILELGGAHSLAATKVDNRFDTKRTQHVVENIIGQSVWIPQGKSTWFPLIPLQHNSQCEENKHTEMGFVTFATVNITLLLDFSLLLWCGSHRWFIFRSLHQNIIGWEMVATNAASNCGYTSCNSCCLKISCCSSHCRTILQLYVLNNQNCQQSCNHNKQAKYPRRL